MNYILKGDILTQIRMRRVFLAVARKSGIQISADEATPFLTNLIGALREAGILVDIEEDDQDGVEK